MGWGTEKRGGGGIHRGTSLAARAVAPPSRVWGSVLTADGMMTLPLSLCEHSRGGRVQIEWCPARREPPLDTGRHPPLSSPSTSLPPRPRLLLSPKATSSSSHSLSLRVRWASIPTTAGWHPLFPTGRTKHNPSLIACGHMNVQTRACPCDPGGRRSPAALPPTGSASTSLAVESPLLPLVVCPEQLIGRHRVARLPRAQIVEATHGDACRLPRRNGLSVELRTRLGRGVELAAARCVRGVARKRTGAGRRVEATVHF
eukprot:scaffold14778_cov109-Isochrysis_galbana.AAC.5